MDKEIRVIENLKTQIEKGRSNFKKSPRERITESYISARLEGLEQLIENITSKHEILVATYDEEVLNDSAYMKHEVYDEAYETYLTYKGELKAVLKKSSSDSTTGSQNVNRESNVRLPKISIPVFNGHYAEWSSFKDLFCSLIHNNTALGDVQRLHYLKTSLKGEAEQLLKQIPITQTNYVKCWDILKKRYDNKRYMLNCVLKGFFEQRTMSVESAQHLKDLLDTTCACLHELCNLGIDVSSWDVIIIYCVSQKLDAETRKQWELHVNSFNENLPSFNNFKEFLESRFRALELIEPTKVKGKPFQIPTTTVLHTTSYFNCPHCYGNHKIYSCDMFAKEDAMSRQDIAKKLGLCFNCLGGSHTVKDCRVPLKCRICKCKHHTLLHGRTSIVTAVATEASEDDNLPESSTETNETTNIINHFTTGKVSNQTLLATAMVMAESKNGYPQKLRALLDQGSQASFISESAVQLLRLNRRTAKSCIIGLGGEQGDLTSKYVVKVTIQSLYDPTFKVKVKAHVLDTVTSILPEKSFSVPNWAELSRIQMADPQYNLPNKIDILLGCEVYSSILKAGLIKSPTGNLIAQDTYFGWVLSGRVSGYDANRSKCHNVIINHHVKIDGDETFSKMILTPEENSCKEQFRSTIGKNNEKYMDELPYQAVIRLEKTIAKPRVVFNASYRRTNEVSLNDTLMKGPTLHLPLLCLTADYPQLVWAEWHGRRSHAPKFRGVGETRIEKHHPCRSIGYLTLTYKEIPTVVALIKVCFNSQPLLQVSVDLDDSVAGYLLFGEYLLLSPNGYKLKQEHSLCRWQITQTMVQFFGLHWSKEYLTHFLQRKLKNASPNLRLGDVKVFVNGVKLPPDKYLVVWLN